MQFLTRLVVTALATAAAVWLVPGITLAGGDNADKAVTLLLVALVFGVVNAVVKPIVSALGTCLVIITFGIFLLVINALMLMLTSWLATQFGIGFHVDGFWPALWGSVIISIVGSVLGGLLGSKKDRD